MSHINNIHANVRTSFNPTPKHPVIDATAYIHPMAAVIGDVSIGRRVMVCPSASVRGDEGTPIHIGDEANIQDGVVLHGLETQERGQVIEKNLREVDGKKYSIYIGRRVSLAHQCHIHGPAVVGDDTFVGMQSFVLMARVGSNCVIEPCARVMGVDIPKGRYVSMGTIVNSQAQANELPRITSEYPLSGLNKAVVSVNIQLAQGYRAEKPTESNG